tara:strand:+ start:147 stop:476 length:330 start_codon:yes stop_codon:yes gene_type:complete
LVVLDLVQHLDGLLVVAVVVFMHPQMNIGTDRLLVVQDQLELLLIQMLQKIIHLLQHLGQVVVMVVMVEVIIPQEMVRMDSNPLVVVEVVEEHLFLLVLKVVKVVLDLS